MKQQKEKKAFTLVETLISIAILVTAVVAPLTIASSSLFQARYSRDQVTATYLAQEAIEMIRYVRDHNLMQGLSGINPDWLKFIPKDKWFAPDWSTAQQGNFQLCSNVNDPESCPYLKYNGAYSLQGATGDSRFKRAVRVITNPSNPDEVKIESKVYWRSGAHSERSIQVQTYIYDWAVVEN